MRARLACVSLATAIALAGCGADDAERRPSASRDDSAGRLTARPRADAKPCGPGEYELRVAPGRRALMRVTRPARSTNRALLLALHGAGSGGAPGGLWAFRGAWALPGLVIVAPSAAGTTWSLARSDIDFVNRALQTAFRRCRVDPDRIAVGGFSAGAGLALWLGLANGDLFEAVIALSGAPLFPPDRIGRPLVVVAHGTEDSVIPVSQGGDAIVRSLKAEGYDVTYRRFRDGHRIVPAIARASVLDALYR